jgi:uncharacterized protein (UPF0548 family)
VLLWRKPSPEFVRRFLERQAALDCSYAAVGATAGEPPVGFVVDRTRVRLGSGPAAFEAARTALGRWEQYRLGWVEAWSPQVPAAAGAAVAILARSVGVWWLNACRVVYALDEAGPPRRVGYAVGTLPEHVETGEERFLVEWDPADDGVWYDVLAFSRPNGWLARVGYPVVRRVQKRFGRDSAAAMLRAVREATERV